MIQMCNNVSLNRKDPFDLLVKCTLKLAEQMLSNN